jgi:hypothetical protein
MNEFINKEDVTIVLYKEDGDDLVGLHITNRDYTSSNKIENENLSFSKELESLDIFFQGDEWVCNQDVDRNQLKKALEVRGFFVIMNENYQ